MSNKPRIAEVMRNRWKTVLPMLGVNERVLDGNHHPCPVSGEGDDRFRFSNYRGNGNFFCACNDGKADGFKLLECMFGWDFKTAASKLEEVAGEDTGIDDETRRDPKLALTDLRNIQLAVRREARDERVRAYLTARGIDLAKVYRPGVLHDAHVNYGLRKIGIFDKQWAMAAKFMAADDSPSTFHLTYLDGTHKAAHERARVIATPASPMAGGAVRLMRMGEDGTLGIGEGIETSLSAAQLFKVPTWAALNAEMLKAFKPPAGCTRLLIFADNDASFTGQAAAYELARRCAMKHGVAAEVLIPTRPDTDWNDELRGAK